MKKRLFVTVLLLITYGVVVNNAFARKQENTAEGKSPYGWLLEEIPSYDGGVLSGNVYNSGAGLLPDANGTTEEDSPMQIVYETNANEFEAYLHKLKDCGYTEVTRNQIGNNIHAEYVGNGTLIYTYYTDGTGTARVIHDKSSDVSMKDFAYTYRPAENERTEIYQFGLYAADPSSTTVDCGMSYVVKLSDNSVVLIDGGHLYQASEEAVEGFMAFLHEITGTRAGDKITVAAYFVSHAHNDHMTYMTKVLHKYYRELDLQRVMFNFPSYQTKGDGNGIYYATRLKYIITTYYPETVYKKLHTGERFNLADLQIEVLYTHEDATDPLHADASMVHDFNCTSTVLKLKIDGKNILLLGDTNTEAETIMTGMYTAATFKSDLIQVAHHGYNSLPVLNAWIAPTIALCPNSYENAHASAQRAQNLAQVTAFTGEDNVYYSGNGTYGFAVVDGEFALIYEKELIGGPYDGSGM